MVKTTLFIDGENFRHKVEEILKLENISKVSIDFSRIDLNKLLENVLKDFNISQKLFYGSKIHEYEETSKKSQELISLQRYLKTNLEKQGFNKVVYLGFQVNPNIGLTHTTNQTILFRNSEIIEVCPKREIKK